LIVLLGFWEQPHSDHGPDPTGGLHRSAGHQRTVAARADLARVSPSNNVGDGIELRVQGDVVAIWAWSLDRPEAIQHRLYDILSPEEKMRAARLRRSIDAARFIVAHGRLRQLLGHVTGRPPAGLCFVRGPHGRPELADMAVRFSLSHSQSQAAVAVAPFAIGADIEMWRPADYRVAGRFFSVAEREGLARLPSHCQGPALLRCWTRKEAVMKATGLGFAMPMASFSVSFGLEEPARVTWMEDDPNAAEEWRLQDLALGPGCTGAVAARRTGWRTRTGIAVGAADEEWDMAPGRQPGDQ